MSETQTEKHYCRDCKYHETIMESETSPMRPIVWKPHLVKLVRVDFCTESVLPPQINYGTGEVQTFGVRCSSKNHDGLCSKFEL